MVFRSFCSGTQGKCLACFSSHLSISFHWTFGGHRLVGVSVSGLDGEEVYGSKQKMIKPKTGGQNCSKLYEEPHVAKFLSLTSNLKQQRVKWTLSSRQHPELCINKASKT